MPRSFLIKKKQTNLQAGNGWPSMSPKLYSPGSSSSGIASPNSATSSTGSSPRNDENEMAGTFHSSSPKYSFDRENQCLDLSMKSLLKEANNRNEKSNKVDYDNSFAASELYPQLPFVSSYPYPSKFAKIADFLRSRQNVKSTITPPPAAENVAHNIHRREEEIKTSMPSPSSTSASHLYGHEISAFSPITAQSSNESIISMPNSTVCSRLPPYSINWSEHFSVNKHSIVSPTPSTQSSDDSGRGSEHMDDNICSAKHIESEHSGKSSKKSDRYHCADCNKSYSTQSGLAKHQEFHCASQVKKSFSCKHCEKVYVSLGALKMHIRTHTLPCKCKLCGKAFSRPWLLQGHIRTHTGEKPFACQYCNRAFADRSNLRAHLQTHSVVKKYSCKTCSRTFSRMSLLLKHEDNGCNGGSNRLSSAVL